MKKNSEEYNQIFVASFLKKLQLSGLDFEFWHTPNGGRRGKVEAGKLKLMGVLPGVLDLCFMSHGKVFFIEFKLLKGKLSKDQASFIEKATRYGIKAFIIYGDTPESYVEQTALIIAPLLGIDQSAISKCSTSALGALKS